MFCPRCGRHVGAGQTHCPACNTELPKDVIGRERIAEDDQPTENMAVTRAAGPPPPEEWFRGTSAAEPTMQMPVTRIDPVATHDESPFALNPPQVRGRSAIPYMIAAVAVSFVLVVALAFFLLWTKTPRDKTPQEVVPSRSQTPTVPKSPSSSFSTWTPSPTMASTAPSGLPSGVSQCQTGLWVNASASCPFATSVLNKVDLNMTSTTTFEAFSPTTNKSYKVTCNRKDKLITCANEGSSRIYIAVP